MITSELASLAGTGGLGEAVLSLSRGLVALGHEVTVVLPFYASVDRRSRPFRPKSEPMEVMLGGRPISVGVVELDAHGGEPGVVMLDVPAYFDRPHLYGRPYADYEDNADRFALLARASIQAIDALDLRPDIVHAHDWQAGLAPVYLATQSALPPHVRSVFTVHNLAFQGLFDLAKAASLDLPRSLLVPEALEFYGRLSFIKGGLVFGDVLTTVSPDYAREIQTEAGGMGLDGVLRKRRQDLFGILNGIDAAVWNPRTNSALPAPFDADDLAGKSLCKAEAQRAMGLPVSAEAMLAVSVSRIAMQKGFDLLADASATIAHRPIQVAVHGGGDPHLEALLHDLAREHPQNVAVRIGYDASFAQVLFGGGDAVIVPSRFEPCGLAQMHGLAYGAVPIVRATGGLKDTVFDVDKDPEAGNGFVFEGLAGAALAQAMLRAEAMFRRPEEWRTIMRRGMREDHSSVGAAKKYVEAYERARSFPRVWSSS
jgi:starch synthase